MRVLLLVTRPSQQAPHRHPLPPLRNQASRIKLHAVATLVLFNVQATAAAPDAVRSIECGPRVVSLPVVAGCAPAPLSPAQLRSTAAAFALTSSKHLAQMGHFVVSCRRCVGSNSASSTLSAVMEISAVVRSKQMGELKRAAAVIAARIDWSRFAANAVERVEHCATSCSASVVLGSAMRAGVVRAAAALLPSHVPPSPTVCHLDAAVFMRACSAVLAAPSGSTSTSGRSVASASCPPHIGLTPAAAFGRMIVSACIAASPAAAFAMQLRPNCPLVLGAGPARLHARDVVCASADCSGVCRSFQLFDLVLRRFRLLREDSQCVPSMAPRQLSAPRTANDR